MKPATLAVLAAAAVALAGCGHSSETAPKGSRPSPVPQLRDMQQLRSVFNAHAGVPRLIVLISPT